MNEIFTKLTEEIKSQLNSNLQTKEVQDVIVGTKAASDTGSFKFIASTPAVDRQGESIDQTGWELNNYLKNSVLLWAHDYSQPPIGVVDKIGLENGNLVIEGRFAPTDFGQQIRKLYDLKMVNTVSVGFIPKEMNGNIITKSELLEVSVVPVPANPQAISLRELEEAGIKFEMLKAKGLVLDLKEVAKVGEPVATEKGAVADRLAAMETITFDTMQEKWDNVDDVYEIVGALCGVYLQPETKPEQFKELLLEAVSLLTSLANDPEAEDATEMEAEKSIIALAVKENKFKEFEYLREKAGRVLSEKNRTLIKTTIDGLLATSTALQELYDATEQGDKQVNLASEKEADETKTNNQFSDAELKAMEQWLLIKQLTGTAVTALSEAGAIVNKTLDAQKK